MSDELVKLRDRIDALDSELLRLLNERAKLAQAVGHIKNGQIYRAEREAQVLRRLVADNPGPLKPENIEHLFREVMSACRDLEQHLRIAYLGPQGTFSQAAAFKQFGHAVGEVPWGPFALAADPDARHDLPSWLAHAEVVALDAETPITDPTSLAGPVLVVGKDLHRHP